MSLSISNCFEKWSKLRFLSIKRNFSGLSKLEEDINSDIKHSIENHWREYVRTHPSGHNSNKTCYILSMFPYPSGQLHMGHVRVYSLSDSIARFHRLCGKRVVHPMGWDAFGLPAENAAIERNVLPAHWTSDNIEIMKKQLLDMGYKFDWDREIATCHPSYYKWTQFIFLKLFENGLAYQKKAVVNWDPVDKTVLADEQVDDNGCSWRSGAKVEKKLLKQWYIKTTAFAKQLYDGLDEDNLKDWKDIINLQKHWIGECDGLSLKMSLKCEDNLFDSIDVWTDRPEKILYAEFITVKPDSLLCRTTGENISHKTVLKITAVHPLNQRELPIVVAENIEYPEGKDVYIASPRVCAEDADLAIALGLDVKPEPKLKYDPIKDRQNVVQELQSINSGVYPVSSKLKDWLISRQRYWGTPIPIIHCDSCGAVPVPYKQLPVELPEVKSLAVGSAPLSQQEEWFNCKCPKCGSDAKRETDTMDTFVDSSWYYLRYLDPHNEEKPFDTEKVESSFPVDVYIGGKEHAVLHLYYARFMTHFFHSLRWISHSEPFKQLLVQGMVMGKSYRVKSTGKYIPVSKVRFENDKAFEEETGEAVESQWEKMSKSKYNGENPQALVEEYGCDTTRLFMLADVTPATYRHWSDMTFPGILNWQHRLWLTVRSVAEHRRRPPPRSLSPEQTDRHERDLWTARNYFTAQITYHFRHTHHLSVAISRLQALTSTLRKMPAEVQAESEEFDRALAALVVMLSPLAPHFACELWAGLQQARPLLPRAPPLAPDFRWSAGVLEQTWPRVDPHYHLTLVCKVDGAVRVQKKMLPDELAKMSHEEALRVMLDDKKVSSCVARGVARTTFDNHEGCGAVLHIFTVQKQKPAQQEKESVNS